MSSNVSLWDNKIHVIYVVELVFYSCVLCGAVAAMFRQASKFRASYLSTISILKIAGLGICLHAAIQTVAATNDQNTSEEPSAGLVTAGSIMIALATAPLLELTKSYAFSRDANVRVVSLSRTGVIAGVALSIAGYSMWSQGNSSSGTGISLVKAASIIYLATYVFVVGFGTFQYVAQRQSSEKARNIALLTVFIAMPFFLIRFIYTIISSFALSTNLSAYHKFNIFNGDWKVYLGMFVVMEFVVELIYLAGLHVLITQELRDRDLGYESTRDNSKSDYYDV
ncbi:LANO_0C00298g1_1 [Lachancea nothofagi CBS 11611]|uniref:LANO_0C00298g1_1 n=1 Tax=Lachancea nothofagi CBS 11611 TaxID=1266666 RepID=A0A1G4J3I7_9SACH|nr:LANO_0C00298g1_1 [Lachancea nothofagi CBS 11611]